MTEADRQKFLVRLRVHNAELGSLTARARIFAKLPCPLLRDGACSIYEARPLACRMHHSQSVEACASNFEDPDRAIPIPPDYAALTLPVVSGLDAGSLSAGLTSRDLELTKALEIALGDSGAETRWLGGEDVFADADDQEVRAEIERMEATRLPQNRPQR